MVNITEYFECSTIWCVSVQLLMSIQCAVAMHLGTFSSGAVGSNLGQNLNGKSAC